MEEDFARARGAFLVRAEELCQKERDSREAYSWTSRAFAVVHAGGRARWPEDCGVLTKGSAIIADNRNPRGMAWYREACSPELEHSSVVDRVRPAA
jgi:hypothetical protein